MLKLLLLSLFTWTVQSSRILGIFPTRVSDNVMIGSRLMNELARKGHNVTFITIPDLIPQPNENITYINIDNEWEIGTEINTSFADRTSMGFIRRTAWYFRITYDVTDQLFSDAAFKAFIKSNETFDLVIAEFSANEAILGVAKVFEAPIILVSPTPSSTLMSDMFAAPAPPSYIPNPLTAHTSYMSYFERVNNLICNSFVEQYQYYLALPWQRDLLTRFIDPKLSLNDLIEDISLILLNSHPFVTEAVPLTPNMIEVGGMHITFPKRVPNQAEDFINNAEDGAIYVALDPNLNHFNYLGPDRVAKILEIFGSFKQRFVWNFPEPPKEYDADKVIFVKDVVHGDFIGHNNIIGAVIDGNLFRIMEAVRFGTPIVGVPLFTEQIPNIARTVRDGYGIEVSLKDIDGENMVKALTQIIEDPLYKAYAEAAGLFFADRQVSPINTAVYWVEYVLRHRGARHFQSPGVQMPLYKRRLVDVLILLIVVQLMLFFLFYFIIKHLLRYAINACKRRNVGKYDTLDDSYAENTESSVSG
ncbi:UDP-glucosyltransferase 2-like [Diabrotica virgifera virgifera]|uniref:UDP-glucuronosyltransferase 2A3-like n=1 Tax=Diabrotica virgifera virgifera TaxID=50390 RepID=A0A6P7FK38_DIAVI|nr:UDP-glucosyltransferase 2-like [Diabrotica virgifera virgifera]